MSRIFHFTVAICLAFVIAILSSQQAFTQDGTQGQLPSITVDNVESVNPLHIYPSTIVAVTSDGLMAAYPTTETEQFVIHLVNTVTGEDIGTFEGHESTVNSLSFSPNDMILASGDNDGTLRIWDVTSGEALQNITDIPDRVRTVKFSPDGSLLASSDASGSITLWDVETWTAHATLDSNESPLFNFSANGEWLLSGSILWNVSAGSAELMLGDRPYGVFSPDGTQLAIREETTFRLLDLMSMDEQVLQIDASMVAFHPDGTVLASAKRGVNTVQIWDLTTGDMVTEIGPICSELQSYTIFNLSFNPESHILAIGCGDGTTRLWDVTTETELKVLQTGYRTTFAFSNILVSQQFSIGTTWVSGVSEPTTNPRQGHWANSGSGDTQVSFDVSADGNIANITLTFPVLGGDCMISIDSITVDSDHTFHIGDGVIDDPEAPNIFEARFINDTQITGERSPLTVCGGEFGSLSSNVGTWDAEWMSE